MITGRSIGVGGMMLAAAWLAWRWWPPSDEAQIRVVLERIADSVGSEAGEARMTRLARVSGLRDELAPHIVVELGPPLPRLEGREAALSAVTRATAGIDGLEIDFADLEVFVDLNRQEADVRLTAEARFDQPNGPRGFDARELQLTFRRAEQRWVIERVTVVRTLEPVGER